MQKSTTDCKKKSPCSGGEHKTDREIEIKPLQGRKIIIYQMQKSTTNLINNI